MQASRAIETGDAELVLTGGVESMSRAPWVMSKPERGFERGAQTFYSTTLGWRHREPPDAGALDDRPRRERRAARHAL